MVYFSYDPNAAEINPTQADRIMPSPVRTKRGAPIPYYMAFPINDGLETEEENQRDFEYIRQLYPEKMSRILSVIEEECDKLEYEGSMMFDEHPDRLMLAKLCNTIYDKVNDVEMEEVYETMQRRPNRPPRHGMTPPPPPRPNRGNWLNDAVQALLYDEMYRRRCRYRNGRCRRWRMS